MPNLHSFHIPVMGTGFTIDTPLKVARYGISSVMSVDDNLMERIREHYCGIYGEVFVPIPKAEHDSRARRITEYLNFVHRRIQMQMEDLKASGFEPETEITKYYELLDDASPLKKEYLQMLSIKDAGDRLEAQDRLRQKVTAGSIDINILTKLDRENYKEGNALPQEYSDAKAALRGFANSNLNSSVIFSAGLNTYLYSYVENFKDFYADGEGRIKKRIILKVSDFRSAFTQAKIFAKKGIWISEYRIESGLNCGGHAFPTEGYLLGPILQEFKDKRKEFLGQLYDIYAKALAEKKSVGSPPLPESRITVQGGIGTSGENRFLLRYYEVDGTGWATPFLLVPEATSVDADTLTKLSNVKEGDITLSNASPLGVPIYNLKNSKSEEVRLERIKAGHPGSPCLNGFMAFNKEFTKIPICTASSGYQRKKIKELRGRHLGEEEFKKECEKITDKACICHDLGDVALAKYGIKDKRHELVPAVCPGPNLVYFSGIHSLREMVDHIYGRINVLNRSKSRPNFFINELKLYVNYLKAKVSEASPQLTKKDVNYFVEFRKNLLDGIEYYKKLSDQFLEETEQARAKFLEDLMVLKEDLEAFTMSYEAVFS